MEIKQDEMTQEIWDEWSALIREQECAECGGQLTIRTVPERATLVLGCVEQGHTGFRQRTSFTEEYRRGAEIHPAIRGNIETKMMTSTEFNRAMDRLALRFPDAIKDAAGASLFIDDCYRLGLDPLIQPAEAIPVPFRTKGKDGKEKITVAMIVTEDGALSMVARGCPDEFDGAPATMPLLGYLMREHPQRPIDELKEMAERTAESLCDDKDAYVWVALGKRRSASSVQPVYGYFTRDERDKAKSKKLPAGTQPGNQARVRAVKRWVRENFPEARQRMIEYTAEIYERAEGALAAREFIDAEYSIITGPLKQTPLIPSVHTVNSPDSETTESWTGNGFSIDPAWLDEILRFIKWTENTAKDWISSRLHVKIEGKLKDGLERLTREQAQEFVKELQERADRQQPELFD